VLGFLPDLASQAAIVIAVLSTRAAAVVRHMIAERFYTISGIRLRPAQFATTFTRRF